MADAFEFDAAKADQLVLVDLLDREVGAASKELAHREGLLHRAFSVVLWREGADGVEVLLARRAQGKYHSAGLWANSCCSHPRSGEKLLDAARRRVREELGAEVDGLFEVGSFVYRAAFDNGIVEYEFDHVLIAHCDGAVDPDPAEADAVRWETPERVISELMENPERFSAWAPNALSLAIKGVSGR